MQPMRCPWRSAPKSRAELSLVVRMLAVALRDIANVADLRGERLSEPAYGPAARALEQALHASLRR